MQLPCFKASNGRPRGVFKKRRGGVSGASEGMTYQEALVLMGFPVDYLESCSLENMKRDPDTGMSVKDSSAGSSAGSGDRLKVRVWHWYPSRRSGLVYPPPLTVFQSILR